MWEEETIMDKVEEEIKQVKKHASHKTYWKRSPFQRLDTWEGRKKPWVPTWTKRTDKNKVSMYLWLIANYTTYGKKKIENPKNIEAGVKPWRLTLNEACREAWISYSTFLSYTMTYPELNKKYLELREVGREYLRGLSEHNIEKALKWEYKTITEKERVDFSFNMLRLTDKEYNPKQVVEQTIEEIDYNRSTKDIISDISDLIK